MRPYTYTKKQKTISGSKHFIHIVTFNNGMEMTDTTLDSNEMSPVEVINRFRKANPQAPETIWFNQNWLQIAIQTAEQDAISAQMGAKLAAEKVSKAMAILSSLKTTGKYPNE
jgi:hypothetical protein